MTDDFYEMRIAHARFKSWYKRQFPCYKSYALRADNLLLAFCTLPPVPYPSSTLASCTYVLNGQKCITLVKLNA